MKDTRRTPAKPAGPETEIIEIKQWEEERQ